MVIHGSLMVKPILFFSDLHSMYAVMVSVAKKVIVFFRGPRGCGDHPGWCPDFVYIIRQTGLFTEGGRNVSSSNKY